jgi:polar amino acid transport system substrate-binding protein
MILALCLLACLPAAGRTLLTGHWTPDEAGLLGPDGLPSGAAHFDLRLLHEAAALAGIGVTLRPLEGPRILPALRAGESDFALPVLRPAEEDARLLWSQPYGTRYDMLFLPGALARNFAEDSDAALAEIARRGLRLAVVRGHPQPRGAAETLAALAAAGRLIEATSDAQALRLLALGRADAAVAERLAGLAALAGPLAGRDIEPHGDPVAEWPLRVAFSRAAVDEATVARLDAAIGALVADGTAAALKQAEARPALLRYVVAANPWLTVLEIAGAVVFAISGVLIARREHWSIFGAFVLAALPTVAGGAMRDLLVGRRPIFIMETPVPLIVVLLVVGVGFLFYRLYDAAKGRSLLLVDLANAYLRVRRFAPPRVLVEVTDSLGLAVLTVTGVLVAVRFGAEPLWLWGPLLAVLTGSGGGILRDVVRSNPAIPGLRTSLYAEIPLVWGLLLSLGVMTFASEEHVARLLWMVVGTVLGAFATRMAVIALRLPAPRF